MAQPTMTPVESSNIKEAGYDHDTHTLYLTFKQGATYAYASITVQEFQYLITADSVGKHFHKMGIKDRGVKLNG